MQEAYGFSETRIFSTVSAGMTAGYQCDQPGTRPCCLFRSDFPSCLEDPPRMLNRTSTSISFLMTPPATNTHGACKSKGCVVDRWKLEMCKSVNLSPHKARPIKFQGTEQLPTPDTASNIGLPQLHVFCGIFVEVYQGPDNIVTVSHLAEGNFYSFRYFAGNSCGWSKQSKQLRSVSTLMITQDMGPKDLKANGAAINGFGNTTAQILNT